MFWYSRPTTYIPNRQNRDPPRTNPSQMLKYRLRKLKARDMITPKTCPKTTLSTMGSLRSAKDIKTCNMSTVLKTGNGDEVGYD
ncbi:hypothetical protein HDU67_005870 [Dinochytrium kinnereticum]|nr:hypothetical protein HDU67_005870 [Dinochytrium kinnereticum]